MPGHRLIRAGGAALSTSSLSAGTIRNFIDNYGYRIDPSGGGDIGQAMSSFSVDPFSLRGPAGVFTNVDDILDLLRKGRDLFGGGPGGRLDLQENGGPIVDRPGVPDFIDRIFGGTLPRGATAYIDLPDGTVGCPSGYHPEKQGKGYCVRNRRMNSLNPRALSRASRRVGGFARAVKRARTLKRICKTL